MDSPPTASGGAYLAEQLASLGYVVVAVDYPLTNGLAPGGPDVKDVVNQLADVSFLIDTPAGTQCRHSARPCWQSRP